MHTLQTIGLKEKDELKGFCTKYPYGNDASFLLDEQTRQKLNAQTLDDFLERHGQLITLQDHFGEIVAVAGYEKLTWDSDFFHMPMGRIAPFWINTDVSDADVLLLAEEAQSKMYDQGIILGYVRIPIQNANALRSFQALDFYTVDVTVEYLFNAAAQSLPKLENPELEFRNANKEDLPWIKTMSERIFSNYQGRFHTDPVISEEKATQLYVEWAKNSLLHGFRSDEFLVCEKNRRPAGFVTLEKRPEINGGEIVVGGVDPEFQSQGIYTELITEGMARLAKSVEKIKVTTQLNNFAVQRTWAKLGFRMTQAYHTLHCQLDVTI